MNVTTVVLMVVGGILIYAGLKDKSPRSIVTDSLKQSAAGTGTAQPQANTHKPPDHGTANV